jgi:hypothetical protein
MAKARYSAEYLQLLHSPHWKLLRALVFNRDDHTCQDCGIQVKRPTKTLWLEADHKVYPMKGAPIEAFLSQPLSDYQTLCCKCHVQKTKQSHQSGMNCKAVAILLQQISYPLNQRCPAVVILRGKHPSMKDKA